MRVATGALLAPNDSMRRVTLQVSGEPAYVEHATLRQFAGREAQCHG